MIDVNRGKTFMLEVKGAPDSLSAFEGFCSTAKSQRRLKNRSNGICFAQELIGTRMGDQMRR